jgi:hypothetical protein
VSDSSLVLPLNEPEHFFAALDGVAGTLGSTYMCQLDQPVEAGRMRSVVRELVSALPRFRGIIERGLWRTYLRILPEDITDVLFEDAWRVESHIDAQDQQAVEGYHNRLINEGLPLERGLACRFRFIPHAQTPILFVTVHHLLFDGRSGIHVMSALVKRLNSDQPIAREGVQSIPVLASLRPQHWWQWPAAIRGEMQVRRQERLRHEGKKVQMATHQDQPFASIFGVRHFVAPCTPAQLRSLGRKLGLSVNGVILMALAEAYLSYAPGDPDAVAVIRQAVDLRPYHPQGKALGAMLGNQVGTYLVSLPAGQSTPERADSVKQQLRAGIERYDKRVMGFSLWAGHVLSYLGPQMMASVATSMQRQLKMPTISCYATNVGNLSAVLNPPEHQIKVKRFLGCGPSGSLLHGISELGDEVTMPLVWQRAEASFDQIDDYLRRLREAFERLQAEGATLERRPRAKAGASLAP